MLYCSHLYFDWYRIAGRRVVAAACRRPVKAALCEHF